MEESIAIQNGKKKNVKLYPIYKMLSWDFLFYYAIIFLFLTQVKGISASDVLLGDACFPLFKAVLQIPATMLIDKIGKRRSLIAANFFVVFAVLGFMIAQNLKFIIVAQFLSAIGYVIKGTCETNILYDSLPKTTERGKVFSKIDGKATSYYYYIDGIASVVSGFLYVIHGYLPMLLCLATCITATILSFQFHDTKEHSFQQKTSWEDAKKSMKTIRYSFYAIFRSNRLRSLLLFSGLTCAFFTCLTTLRSSLLKDLAVPEEYFGIIFAVLGIVSGISAKNQARFHNRFHNKTLAVLTLPVAVSCIIIGFMANASLASNILMPVVLFVYFIHYLAKGAFYVLNKRYQNNFSTSSFRTKISSANTYIVSIFTSIVVFFASFLLKHMATSYVLILLGCILTALFVLLLDYMRKRVGLNPEEYSKKEIEFTEIH